MTSCCHWGSSETSIWLQVPSKAPATKSPRQVHQFKNKGNQKRYEDNADILEKLEAAEEAIEKENIAKAKENISAGKQLLNKQQKYIRIADREEYGWEVVRHYISDDLASNSEDEKAISRARREALASIKKKKSAQAASSTSGSSQNFRTPLNQSSPKPGSSREQPDRSRSHREVRDDVCYACGERGHMQYSCPTKFSSRRWFQSSSKLGASHTRPTTWC